MCRVNLHYIQLQKQAKCVLSDSGTIAEEASLLNLPAVTLRQAHERPEGMDEGTVIMADVLPDRVLQAVAMAIDHHCDEDPHLRPVEDYEGGRVSLKVVRIIQSYTDYVRHTVWRE